MATCVGLFLFTRIVISRCDSNFTIALAMWAFLRAPRRRGAAPAVLGIRSRCQPGDRASAEKPDRPRFSRLAAGGALSFPDQAIFFWLAPGSGYVPSAVYSLHSSLQRPGTFWPRFVIHPISLSRFTAVRANTTASLVLFYQRAGPSLPQFALSSRLQYGPPARVLAAPFFSGCSRGACVTPCHRQALLQTHRASGPHASAGDMLDWIYPGVLHVFNGRRNITRCLLSRAGLAAGLSDGCGR